MSINLGLVVGLHLQQSSDLLDHQVRKSFEYSRDFWKTNEERPLVIQSPYVSHKSNQIKSLYFRLTFSILAQWTALII